MYWISTYEVRDAMIEIELQTLVALLTSTLMELIRHLAFEDTMLLFWTPEQVL